MPRFDIMFEELANPAEISREGGRMTHRARPGDDSLPPGENPAAPGPDQGRGSRSKPAARQEPRFTADIMLIGSGWHQPDQPEDPPSPSASPDALTGTSGADAPAGVGEPGSLAGASASARA